MIRYKAIDFDLGARATSADLDRLEMTSSELKAYFSVIEQGNFLKVSFPDVDIFRVIDDMHQPMEERGMERSGHIPGHFAYIVEGSPFWATQREHFEISLPGSTHYMFVTGGNCLDVISRDKPCFSWVSSPFE